MLQVCAVAYFFLDPEPQQACRNLSVSGHAVQTVFVGQPAFDRRLDRVFFQIKLDDSGTIDATVDDAHLYVVGRQVRTGTSDALPRVSASSPGPPKSS